MERKTLRLISEIIFLLLFAFLFLQGRLQIWVLAWFAGILLSFVFSRVYCGWACPIGTLMRFQSWLYKKMNIKRFDINKNNFVTSVRYILLAGFFAGMFAVRARGVELNIIFYLVIAGAALSFFFEENFWHKICPHGTVLALTNKATSFNMEIEKDKCAGCGLCEQVCPNQTIRELEDGTRKIVNKECLVCRDCESVCPVNAISYGK